MQRLHDWPARLSDAIVAARGRELVIGEHDCCLFIADCVLALTGTDIANAVRGRYDTEAEGLALMGVKSFSALPGKCGFKAVHQSSAHRGDIALAKVEEPGARRARLVLAIVDGIWLRGAAGTVYPRAGTIRAWRVG